VHEQVVISAQQHSVGYYRLAVESRSTR